MHAFGGLKCFLVVAEALKSHHVSCNRSNWRKWVQLGPTYSEAIFGRCCRNRERLETAGVGYSRLQKRHRSLWLAKDLKCPNYSLNQRAGLDGIIPNDNFWNYFFDFFCRSLIWNWTALRKFYAEFSLGWRYGITVKNDSLFSHRQEAFELLGAGSWLRKCASWEREKT